jgi:HEPN domain-containing protein
LDKLSEDYLKRAIIRYEVLNEYLKREGYAEVVREAQETVELLLKAVLLDMGLIVPTMHDVSIILDKNKEFLKEPFLANYLKH